MGELQRRALLGLGALGAQQKTAPATPIEWESATLDAAVFEALRTADRAGDRELARDYAAAMEGAYAAAGGLARRLHADGVNAEFAARLHLSRPFVEGVAAWPRVAAAAQRVFVERAAADHDEGADLREVSGGRAVHVLVRLERFAGPPGALAHWLAHELAHVDDVVDPAFGAAPGFAWPGRTPGEQHRQRDRYRALWCFSIDARLEPRGLARTDARARRAFVAEAFRDVPPRVLDAVTATLSARAPTHAELLDAAVDPCALAAIAGVRLTPEERRELAEAKRPATCTLCAFPTTGWSRPADWTPAMVLMVRTRKPRWSPADGACEQCRECYESRAGAIAAAANPGGAR